MYRDSSKQRYDYYGNSISKFMRHVSLSICTEKFRIPFLKHAEQYAWIIPSFASVLCLLTSIERNVDLFYTVRACTAYTPYNAWLVHLARSTRRDPTVGHGLYFRELAWPTAWLCRLEFPF